MFHYIPYTWESMNYLLGTFYLISTVPYSLKIVKALYVRSIEIVIGLGTHTPCVTIFSLGLIKGIRFESTHSIGRQ